MNQSRRKNDGNARRGEGGYALIALIGIMTFGLILTTAAAPMIKKEMQREKEAEMLWRGQQIAKAIERFCNDRGGPSSPACWPTDLKKDLVDGVTVGTKKIRYLRPSALCDPMTPCISETNWRTVHPGDPLPKELYDAYIQAMQKSQVPLSPQPLAILEPYARLGASKLPGQILGSGEQGADTGTGQGATGGGLSLDSQAGSEGKKLPIIGVVSKRSDRMFRSYFGIEEYDHTLFFPAVPVLAGGVFSPLAFSAVPTNAANPKCQGGGVMIGGKCWGGLQDGQCPPSKRGPDGSCTPGQ